MNILFVNEKCGYFGGVEQNVAATATGLRALGHRCFLAYGVRTDIDVDRYKSCFDEAYPCRDIADTPGDETNFPFRAIMDHCSADVLYVHKIPSIDVLTPWLGRTRAVRMVHDHDLCCPRRHKYFFHNGRVCHVKAGWRCYLDLAFLGRPAGTGGGVSYVSIPEKLRELKRNYRLDRLLVGSSFMKDELLSNGFPPEKVQVLPPVVPLKPAVISPIPMEPVILYVGQLIRGKGVDLLLRALQGITCSFHAVIVGTGNAELGLKELTKALGLEDRVLFKGWIGNEAIGEYYAGSRVVVVPSRWPEPFGMIGLEAMHHGRPVVAFDVGGISDWLEHGVTGLLVAEQDTEALGAALEIVLLDTDLADRMGQKGVAGVSERFSFDRYLERLVGHLTGEA